MAFASAEMSRVFGEYAKWNRRSLPVLLERLAEDLTWDLFYQTGALREQQQQKIDKLPETLDWHIKRRLRKDVGTQAAALSRFRNGPKTGQFRSNSVTSQIHRASQATHVTVPEEIRLRKRFAAWFQATGWISRVLNKTLRRGKVIRMTPEAVVVKQLGSGELRISVTNPRPNSAEFAAQNGIQETAAGYRTGRMLNYIKRHADKGAAAFSRKTPDFSSVDMAAEVTRAMAGRAAA